MHFRRGLSSNLLGALLKQVSCPIATTKCWHLTIVKTSALCPAMVMYVYVYGMCCVRKQRNSDAMKRYSCTCGKTSLREMYATGHTSTTHVLKLQQVIRRVYMGHITMLFTLIRAVDNSPFERSCCRVLQLLWVIELQVNLSLNASYLYHVDLILVNKNTQNIIPAFTHGPQKVILKRTQTLNTPISVTGSKLLGT
jgi:hypothetical protein